MVVHGVCPSISVGFLVYWTKLLGIRVFRGFQQESSMRLTTKGRFAVTAMIDLALRQTSGPVTLAAISQRQQVNNRATTGRAACQR